MSVSSPVTEQKHDLIKFAIKVGGQEIDSNYTLEGVDIYKKINKITTAQITYYDGVPYGSTPKDTFPFKDKYMDKIVPGKEIEVEAGYEQDGMKTVFKGIVTNVSVKTSAEKAGLTVIQAADKFIKSTEEKINKVFYEEKDSDIVRRIANKYGEAGTIDATDYTHKEITQYYATDWDFLITRAQMNGRVVKVDQNKLHFVEPGKDSSSIDGEYGYDFIKVNLEVDGMSQLKSVKTRSWDPNTHEVWEKTSKEPDPPSMGSKAQHGEMVSNLEKKEQVLHAPGQVSKEELQAWADSQLLISRFSRIRGTIAIQGYNDIEANQTVKVKNTGQVFDGDAYVSGVHHKIKNSNFTTELTIGMDTGSFVQEKSSELDMHGNGIIPGITGLSIGKVLKIHDDPEGEFRVQVELPMVPESQVWARLGKFFGSNDYGSFFFPGIGDEVIVGFLGGDPRYPILMGSVYSKKHPPHYAPDGDNSIQAITTKNELKLIFEDKDKNIIIETPGGRRITLTDKDKEIIIEDDFKNKITMKSGGIYCETPKDFEISAKGKVLIEAVQGVTIDGKQSKIEGKAMTVDLKATNGLTAKGLNATLEGTTAVNVKGGMAKVKGTGMAALESSGNTAVKGTLVMIN